MTYGEALQVLSIASPRFREKVSNLTIRAVNQQGGSYTEEKAMAMLARAVETLVKEA